MASGPRAEVSRSFHNPRFWSITHTRLLSRVDRTLAVARAIHRAVKPGMRVLDAGCGTGLLSFLALKAGAAQVVAVDRENVELAQALAAENDLSAKITFVDADLHALTADGLGGRFDLILAFVYTNHLVVDEARADLVCALRERFGAPGCRVVPDRVAYSGALCEWPGADAWTELHDLRRTVRDMESRYELRLGALMEVAKAELRQSIARPRPNADYEWSPAWGSGGYRYERGGFRILGDEVAVATIRYDGAACTRYPDELALGVQSAGVCNAVLWTQELWSGDQLVWTAEHMSTLARGVPVRDGQRVALGLDAGWRDTNTIERVRVV